MIRAKIFKDGENQAIQLPKKFRLKENEFYIRKEGANIILTPVKNAADELWKLLDQFSKDLLLERNQPKFFDKHESL